MPPSAPDSESDPGSGDDPARLTLTRDELLALQLVARGYTLAQIARQLGVRDAGGVVALLRRAAEALGATDAVAEAKRRGLLV